MSESQYAVLHFDVEAMTMSETTPVVFDSHDEARAPAQGCRMYDHIGKTTRTFSDEINYGQYHGGPAAKRTLIIGVIGLSARACSVGLNAWRECRLALGVSGLSEEQ